MKKKLSIIIPSFDRQSLLVNNVRKLLEDFEILEFDDFEIIIINNGIKDQFKFEFGEKVKIFSFIEKIAPGIARNIGVQKSNSEWIWFIDDDDELIRENLTELINMLINSNFDLITHSLKNKYLEENSNTDLLKNVLLFREKQELFNFIFKRKTIDNNNILFSDGIHEDIRYSIELLLFSKKIGYLNKKIYIKNETKKSITENFYKERIDGYLNALSEILDIKNDFIIGLNQEIVVQFLGTILYSINKIENKQKRILVKYLDEVFVNKFRELINLNFNEKDSNFKFASTLYLNKSDNDIFINDLDYCFSTHLSCKDLKNSIFFGPQEIIGCCKRFFYEGKMKGDIILMKNSKDVSLDSIQNKKKQIENLINCENYDECKGCPYIERFKISDENKINYISIENFTYCNMKCTYCSPKYYNGKEPSYDTDSILTELLESNISGRNIHVVFGGGEPTLKPKFDLITKKLINSDKISKIRVLSNSLKISNYLLEVCDNDKIRIVTSVDAGSQVKFQEIRGRGKILDVLENLNFYNKKISSPENLTIKYILTDENYISEELVSFVELLKSYDLHKNLIQISCNFKMENTNEELTFAIYELASLLLKSGFNFVFFDDLIRDRLSLSYSDGDKILEFLKSKKLMHANIFSHKTNKKIILWGDGYQSQWIKNKTLYGKEMNVISIIKSEDELLKLNLNQEILICPAGIQSLPEIIKNINKSNFKHNIIFPIFI